MTFAPADEGAGSDLLCELAAVMLPFGLTPTECRLAEEAIDDCSPGDIEAERIVPIHIVRKRVDAAGDRGWPANEIEVTYLRQPSGQTGHIRFEILDKSDITALAQAFLWLLHRDDEGELTDGA